MSTGACAGFQVFEHLLCLSQQSVGFKETLIEELNALNNHICGLHDFLLIFYLPLLAPADFYHTKEGVEILRGGDYHIVFEGPVIQFGIALEGQLIGTVVRDVHNDIVETDASCMNISAVILEGEFFDMLTHTLYMAFESGGTLGVGGGIVVIYIRRERHLGVDDDISLIREMEDDIGLHTRVGIPVLDGLSVFVAECDLFRVLHASLQSHIVEKLIELKFAEVTLRFVLGSEGACETVGTLTDALGLLHTLLETLIKTSHTLGMGLMAPLYGFLHLTDAALEGREDFGELLIAGIGQFLAALSEHGFGGGLELLLDE